MRRLAIAFALLLAGGCAPLGRDERTLAAANARAAQGDYPAAMAAYEAYLARNPQDERARAARTLVGDLIAVRAELTALRDRLAAREAELSRQASAHEAELSRQASAREAELARLRHELSVRQAEVARLREDLEALKRSDLDMERRRR